MRIATAVRSWRSRPVLTVDADPANVESVTVRYLMFVLLPAWFLPGVADYLMHRRTRIERTSGLRESLIHSLMMAEIGIPLTLVLLCEVTPELLAATVAAAGVHEATAIWDVRAATRGGREVRPAEQHIHSFLESLPFMATSALCCLHWDRVVRPRGHGGTGHSWTGHGGTGHRGIRLRERHLPVAYLAGVAAATAGLIAAPYAEEAVRCARWAAGKRDRG